MPDYPKISAFGDRSFLIDFGGGIGEETLKKVLFYKNILENERIKEKVEITNTYNSLLVSYELAIEDVYGEFLRLNSLFSEAKIPKNNNYKTFNVPVCYDADFGWDLDFISVRKNLRVEEIIRLHTAPVYQIYFIGFLPGFLYLGGLDPQLQISRKKTPRKLVEKGSVGIGENQTGIYPKNSPGGWQILGRSPLKLFDKNEDLPCPFSAGDKIKFFAVSREEYDRIHKEINEGNYELKFEDHHG
ncbi:5-oxoprolinase subunit PxpB [Christiangramia sabulilitoris]|uniref:5-oxoprolinase subunit PxpB n=1 Tax=Christiangramia sabulilitoris TaxID=2583991 RepID=A0A550I2M6_9FLAO|nr:5-oxoprolinase subunit PxpB [Christiangramia sabulilitoris]TRO65191.1 5-oxoprolinase subunit PxpB [Christiangramia sabulilitoris]